jgi:prepilin-type N-terminal cleavage/methylation domain-containing protein
MLTSLRKRQSGFTIVELLIVIIIIGILATLVVVQFTNQQKKARDTQRKTDIGAIETHLETYYASEGVYPTFVELSDADFRSANLKGLKSEALVDPKEGAIKSGAPDADQYGYTALPSGCTDACENYEVSAVLEADGTTYTKKSEN